jgi:hypothetical protein
MNVNQVISLMDSGETETVEFKESINSSCKEERTKSLVAFANRDGGRLLFGVDDDGSLRGVQIGQGTLESLATYVTLHTYPSLPIHIEEVKIAGKSVIIAEAASDRPPVIGLYLFSNNSLSLDDQVDAAKLVALRRVGRTNQTVDLMWMRPEMRSDPKLRLNVQNRWINFDDEEPSLVARAWVEDGSATAHEITFRTEPPAYQNERGLDDLPVPYKSGGGGPPRKTAGTTTPEVHGWQAFGDLSMDYSQGKPDADYCLIATYKDDAGLTWEARRWVSHEVLDEAEAILRIPGKFSRRIVKFPPKRTVQP